MAARLASNSSLNILILEAGPPSADLETVHMAGLWSENFDKETDWNIITSPQNGINDRQVKLSRGKFLGGSSSCNATLCIRGSPQDYDDWGVEGWSGKDMFKYMKKAEKFTSKPWFKADEGAHGYDGKIGTSPHDLAPISELIAESMQDKGLDWDADMFSRGENPHGCGHVPRTVVQGWRTTSADFVTKANEKSNIDIVTDAHVDKVVIEKEANDLVAKGVEVVLADGTVAEVRAEKEVIVSGGSYCSPIILNRSGIGARQELEKHGIETLVELPAVGKNLMDHIVSPLILPPYQSLYHPRNSKKLSIDFRRFVSFIMRPRKKVSHETSMPTTITLLLKPSPNGRQTRQVSCLRFHLEYSASHVLTPDSRTPSSGTTPIAQKAAIQWL